MKIKVRGRNRVGLVLRVFARTPKLVESEAHSVLKAARIASNLGINGENAFKHILISVVCDTRRIDHDCGETAGYLREALKREPVSRVRVHEVRNGDLFVGVLNDAIGELQEARCRYMTVFSHTAADYLTTHNMRAIFLAIERGAKVAGVAIRELQQSVIEGRVANTFATWELKALGLVGNFNPAAAQPYKDERLNRYIRGWTPEDGELFYPVAGVEEIMPLCRLVEHFEEECIAPIFPHGEARWVAPDPTSDPEGHWRHLKKMATRHSRQLAFAIEAGGFDLSHLKKGVMAEYRHF